ncbi:MAG: site-2 protease family protein, partial [Betaproteobacteria bacterium]|nr:site-2 protease family protein [Betaproteobacteria bacterium]
MDEIIQGIAIYALPVIFAITMHEAAHGYIAKQFGDLTAYSAGRISLNPARHIDPVGTILVPLSLFVLSKLTV